MASSQTRPRPLRADAERNRRRLMAAAQELFAIKGLAVGLDEIARHAGVGVGTAYRRFPDKEQLIDALFEDHIGRIVALAERALAYDDAWSGLVAYLEGAVEVNATNRGVKELMFSGKHGAALVGRARRQLAPLVQELVRRAQASGDVRADVEFTDMPLIQFMVAGLADLGGPHAPAIWRRQLGIVLDGLRTPEPRPLAEPPIGLQTFVETVSAERSAGGTPAERR